MRLYLASRSPRRTKLLKEAGLSHRIVRSAYEETGGRGLGPAALVRKHAMGKALAALPKVDNGLLVAADTIVYYRGKIIGKPRSRREAETTLLSLQGRWHAVYTGVALIWTKNKKLQKKVLFHEKTKVLLKKMDLAGIRRYFLRVDPMDKAGAYAIQTVQGTIVEKVSGSFSNAVGLPMERLCAKMRAL